MENQDDLKKAYQISFVIGIAIIGSLCVYAVVVFLIKAQSMTGRELATIQDVGGLRYIFYALSVGIVILLRISRGLLLRRGPSDSRQRLIGKLQRTAIISMALSEGPVLFGLVLFFLGGRERDFIVLFFVSLVLVFMYFPRLKNWTDWLQQEMGKIMHKKIDDR